MIHATETKFEVPGWLTEARRSLAGLGLPPDWPEESIQAPAYAASRSADCALRLLAEVGLRPSRLIPALDGGVCIAFTAADRYADIQFLNDGEVLATYSEGTRAATRVWRVQPGDSDLEGTLHILRALLS